ncbi:hypothetical protein BABINDRAFT_161548 [Babjeviella inositovora NRRL Y-12698]|uniref:Copper acquisition factor BIM1-like domain-containing protein n=1 Tax=Babjeviella inositovora NRRL Y-12698 TaxID=984486 RepID=A0A1E3QS67_9ASCO|nr:uncharacterized protein BABINDRAFT_161548 [Babjeviella inositovora NRRL Y-12698]ODQ79872.1 hypothetical protein BABINDRAFT_161548 [Babjeviella inositovora NRRL Y-12698]
MVPVKFAAATLFFASTALAHFRIPYPGERNATNWDTQTTGPCGGDNSVVEPRFLFNPLGSPLDLNMKHNLSVGQVRFCPGDDCTTQADFSVILVDSYEHKGVGNYCIPAVLIPFPDGTNGTIQVIYAGTGDAEGEYDHMFNCLDVTVSSEGEQFSGQCTNSSNVAITPIHLDSNLVANATNITILNSFYESTMSAAAAASATATDGGMAGMDMSDMCGMAGMSDMPGMSCLTTAVASATQSVAITTRAVSSASVSSSAKSTSSSKSAGSADSLRMGCLAGVAAFAAALL